MSSRRKDRKRRPSHRRRGVTLTELLIVIGLMAFLSSIALVGLWEAQEVARESRARSQVQRIEALLMERWDDYASRAVPLKIVPTGTDRGTYARLRVNAIRELARFELPDRILDVAYNSPIAGPPTLTSNPSLLVAYRRLLGVQPLVTSPAWSEDYQGAECLYAILATTYKGDENGLSFFKASEIGDKDNDGRPEILDPWGNPIEFIRWAPGFKSPVHSRSEIQTIGIYGTPDGGTFQLKFAGTPTASSPIGVFASAGDVQTELLSMGAALDLDTNDDTPDDPVTGPEGGPWTVRFAKDANPALLIGDATGLTGGNYPGGRAFIRVETNFIDPFDPDEAWGGGPPLHPLVVSAGRDGKYGIFGLKDPDSTYGLPVVDYSPPALNPPNNPYATFIDPQNGQPRLLGDIFDYDGDFNPLAIEDAGDRGPSSDNISNHLNDAG